MARAGECRHSGLEGALRNACHGVTVLKQWRTDVDNTIAEVKVHVEAARKDHARR